MENTSIHQKIAEAYTAGQPIVVATIISDSGSVPRHTGAKMVIYPDGTIFGTIGGGEFENRAKQAAVEVFQSGKPRILSMKLVDPAKGDAGVCGGQAEIFLEPVMSEPTILIIGAGHCGKALAELAKWLNFRVVITDDRSDLLTEEILPGMDRLYLLEPEEIGKAVPIDRNTYIAAVSRNVDYDVAMLPGILKTEAAYIGIMGSQRRWLTTVSQLKDQGVKDTEIERITAPLGLEIQAETPQEIAVSIMAQVIEQIRTS